MNLLFKSRQRSPSELGRGLRELCMRLGASVAADGTWYLADVPLGGEGRRKVHEEIWQALQQAKLVLYGEGDSDPIPEQVAQLAQEVYQQQLMPCLLTVMPRVEFETRKDIVQVFIALLQRQIGTRRPTVEYLRTHPAIVLMAFRGYDIPDIAMNTGLVLNEMVHHEPLAKILLYSNDISCDAFKNLRDVLVLHRSMTAEYLQQNYETFFAMFTQLLDSSNYVTRRQSLKLLGELLVDRAHYATMVRYVSSEENLKRTMNALRDRSKHIQLEAFHVFKVFVANPKKTPAVEAILRRNKERLITFLQDFPGDRTDESFLDECQYILHILSALPSK